jgi:peroxiredoxin (alkyl hydroperoxide reductase subunit C)
MLPTKRLTSTMNDPVTEQQSAPRPLRLGDTAPNFAARTTMGEINLSDFRGRWLSEFVALTKAAARFAALDCALLAISVDSLYSHLAWVRAIRESFGVTVSFPIIEDPSMVIGRAYGMICATAEDAGTMRSTFFIDPAGVIRAMNCYPTTVGRSVNEILRVLAALQRVDADDVVTPADWQPGDDVLLPPRLHQDALLAEGCADDWFQHLAPDKAAR